MVRGLGETSLSILSPKIFLLAGEKLSPVYTASNEIMNAKVHAELM